MHPDTDHFPEDKEFFPKGAIAFFLILLMLGGIIFGFFYFLMIYRL